MKSQVPNAWSAGDAATRQTHRAYAFATKVAASKAENNPEPPRPLVSGSGSSVATVTAPSVTVAAAPSSDVFACIAEAETGNGAAMQNGPVYWTRYGMVTGVITGWGTAEEQAAIFGGYATAEQERSVAAKFAAENGFGGWGVLTKQKCGL